MSGSTSDSDESSNDEDRSSDDGITNTDNDKTADVEGESGSSSGSDEDIFSKSQPNGPVYTIDTFTIMWFCGNL